MKYFQCTKCKKLIEMIADKITSRTVNQTDGGTIDIYSVKPENLSEIICHGRRMRELTKDKYDHEIIQRDYIDGKGPAPVDTEHMKKLNI